ncbi:hypothetical protein AAC387_Pa06g3154 [Persea americana]
MNLSLHSSPHRFSLSISRPSRSHSSPTSSSSSSLPFAKDKAKYYGELEAAVDAVQRACRLCVDVKRSLFSGDGRILEKNDQTPVTIADFGVQALVSLELSRLFPSIPLVAEEDSSFLRANLAIPEGEEGHGHNLLVDSVFNAVIGKASVGDKSLTHHDVLEAIDRGGQDAFALGAEPATYWVLDPIDGTRGFVKGSEALYVVGLALVVEGEITLGVMGCPKWQEDHLPIKEASNEGWVVDKIDASGQGVIMFAHVGCGTWKKSLSEMQDTTNRIHDGWVRCFVDEYSMVHEAKFCVSYGQSWESLPLSTLPSSTTDADSIEDNRKVSLLPTCCGSLCKYLMVASGRASVFILRVELQTAIKAWDHAAGMICVNEAGGQVTDWKGSRLDLAVDQVGRRAIFPSGGVLVTNGNLHNQILEMILSSASLV